MVCDRCKLVVENLLKEQGYNVSSVELGSVTIQQKLNDAEKEKLDKQLTSVGFELLQSKEEQLIETVKKLLIELVFDEQLSLRQNLSDYLAQQLHQDYSALSNLFSKVYGKTIEQYFISLKIERAKELLLYDELSISEIAYRLNYSSSAYLSKQFKQVTGQTPSAFKKQFPVKRRPLNQL